MNPECVLTSGIGNLWICGHTTTYIHKQWQWVCFPQTNCFWRWTFCPSCTVCPAIIYILPWTKHPFPPWTECPSSPKPLPSAQAIKGSVSWDFLSPFLACMGLWRFFIFSVEPPILYLHLRVQTRLMRKASGQTMFSHVFLQISTKPMTTVID